MKAPHLNEFLRRAIKANILKDLILDFTSSAGRFCERKVVEVDPSKSSYAGLIFIHGSRNFTWGMGGGSLSPEIVSVRLVRRSSGYKVHISLGRTCNHTGDLR